MTSKNSNSKGAEAPVENVAPEAPEAPAEAVVEAPQAPVGVGVEALASAVGASPKDVRRWLRAQTREALGKAGAAEALPGKGGRYAFTPEDVQALARAYGASKASKGTRAPASAILAALAPAAPAAPAEAPVE